MNILFKNNILIPSSSKVYRVKVMDNLALDENGWLIGVAREYNDEMTSKKDSPEQIKNKKYLEISVAKIPGTLGFYFGHLFDRPDSSLENFVIEGKVHFEGNFLRQIIVFENFGKQIKEIYSKFPEQLKKETKFLTKFSEQDDYLMEGYYKNFNQEGFNSYCLTNHLNN